MAVEKGKFQLYNRISPPLEAGDWRLVLSQNLAAQASSGTLDADDLKVDDANINFRVRSPRYLMPPDQVLSTYPPANSFGSYGSRLPQVVIKRRTLPWERALDDAPEDTPWLALVLIAEGEAQLDSGVDVADCVSPGVTLSGVADVEKGNRLVVRKSVIDKVFPTRNDVPLLAHAREVDISDTELLMGDDDGFLAVVISNRLPLPGRDADGADAPVKYLACLVNLEGQFDALLERSPDPAPTFTTGFVTTAASQVASAAAADHTIMDTVHAVAQVNPADVELDIGTNGPGPAPLAQSQASGSISTTSLSGLASTAGATPNAAPSQWSSEASAQLSSAELALQMAHDFSAAQTNDNGIGSSISNSVSNIDPEFRFPVLMHWSFTTSGDTTFRSLMNGLDSGLLGDVGEAGRDGTEPTGRLPLEVVESGHVGLGQKTREGDQVRCWYRGPLVPHPTVASSGTRLPLAHSSDQLRIVIQDGREDLSLAAAFETGRLLSLSQPSIVASLMRWRQGQYHAARIAALLEANRPFWQDVLGVDFVAADIQRLGPAAGRLLIDAIVANPEGFLGAPRPRVSPGRPLAIDGLPSDLLATGLGIQKTVFKGDMSTILDNIRVAEQPSVALQLDDLGTVNVREQLEASLDSQRIELVTGALNSQFTINAVTGPAFPVINRIGDGFVPDRLDAILANERDDIAPGDSDDSNSDDEDQP